MLVVTDLSAEYDDQPLFQGLSFELAPGHYLQIMGPNGSGKTTLLRALAGLKTPRAGKIHGPNDQAPLYLSHKSGLKPHLTVYENIQLYAGLLGQPKDAAQVLDALGLAHKKDWLAETLSAGQQRRLCLARLLLAKAQLWILDEPFTALDQQGIAWLETCLQQHLDRQGMLIFTSHQTVRFNQSVLQMRDFQC